MKKDEKQAKGEERRGKENKLLEKVRKWKSHIESIKSC